MPSISVTGATASFTRCTSPKGSTYSGEVEEFVAGTPLALTDVVVNPQDGAMYFTVGGRNTQSGLYRVTYVGPEPAAPTAVANPASTATARETRRSLEAFHGRKDEHAVQVAWPYLGNSDRFIRSAARVAIEWQDPASWREKTLAEASSPASRLNALLALARVSAPDPAHRTRDDAPPDPALRDRILAVLDGIAWEQLDRAQQLDLLRVYQVVLNRFGRPDTAIVRRLTARFDPHYPALDRELNSELCQLLVYLQAPSAAAKTVALLERAFTQEEQLDFGRDLRALTSGWTPVLRTAFFSWIQRAKQFRGGNSLRGFVANIKRDAIATLSEQEKAALKPILDAPAAACNAASADARPAVRQGLDDRGVDADRRGRPEGPRLRSGAIALCRSQVLRVPPL